MCIGRDVFFIIIVIIECSWLERRNGFGWVDGFIYRTYIILCVLVYLLLSFILTILPRVWRVELLFSYVGGLPFFGLFFWRIVFRSGAKCLHCISRVVFMGFLV